MNYRSPSNSDVANRDYNQNVVGLTLTYFFRDEPSNMNWLLPGTGALGARLAGGLFPEEVMPTRVDARARAGGFSKITQMFRHRSWPNPSSSTPPPVAQPSQPLPARRHPGS